MSKPRKETRQYKQGPLTLRALKSCGYSDPKLDRLSAVVGAACTVWLAKKGLLNPQHSWRQW